jgi:integrase
VGTKVGAIKWRINLPKVAKALTAIEVKRLNEPGLHMVGVVPGLGLKIKDTGNKSWILRVINVDNRRSDIGLGSYPEIPLALAHEKARKKREEIRQGIDPIEKKKDLKKNAIWTFKHCAEEYIKIHQASWKSIKHKEQWESTLNTYAYPKIGGMHVRDVGTKQILDVLEPYWNTKNVTINRVRNRIERILDWAKVRKYREGDNPAAWRGVMEQALPKPSKVSKVTSFKGVPIDEMYDFMQRIKKDLGMGARCLELVILTACRSGEARGATWSEIDLKKKEWRIPGERMKVDRNHRIPLNDSAIKLLKSLPKNEEGVDLVFPGAGGKPLSDMTLSAVMRRMKLGAVPHGFRSTFATWAQERTNYPSDVRERALAHTVGSKTTEAYERGDQFDKRVSLMSDWDKFINTKRN